MSAWFPSAFWATRSLVSGSCANPNPSPAVASKVIEDAYQSYQRFGFIGKPADAPGPYFIDFGNECDAELEHRPEQRRADSDKEQAWRRRAVCRVAA